MTDPHTTAAWEHIGRWLKAKRDLAGLSRREVHDLGGPSISTQQQLEDGGRQYRGEWVYPSPDAKTWGRLTAALDVDLEELAYEGDSVGLWDREKFPLVEALRHNNALAGVLWANELGPHAEPRDPRAPVTAEEQLTWAVQALTEVVKELRDDLRQSRQSGSAPPPSDP